MEPQASELTELDDAMEVDTDDPEDAPQLIPQAVTSADLLASAQARIDELTRQLMDVNRSAGARILPAAGPDDVIEWMAPVHPIEGKPYTINGKGVGPGPVKTARRVADQIMALHSNASRIESERMMMRGSEIAADRMDPFDAVSKQRQRNRGSRVL